MTAMAENLTKAYLEFTTSGAHKKIFQVQFNPTELRLSARGTGKSRKKGLDGSASKKSKKTVRVEKIKGVSLSVKLIFDAGEEAWAQTRYDVAAAVQGLAAAVRENAREAKTTFCWGDLAFPGILESVSAQYVMFDSSGAPLRADVELELYMEDKDDIEKTFGAESSAEGGSKK